MQWFLHKCIQLDLAKGKWAFSQHILLLCKCKNLHLGIMQLGEGKGLKEMQEINGTGVG